MAKRNSSAAAAPAAEEKKQPSEEKKQPVETSLEERAAQLRLAVGEVEGVKGGKTNRAIGGLSGGKGIRRMGGAISGLSGGKGIRRMGGAISGLSGGKGIRRIGGAISGLSGGKGIRRIGGAIGGLSGGKGIRRIGGAIGGLSDNQENQQAAIRAKITAMGINTIREAGGWEKISPIKMRKMLEERELASKMTIGDAEKIAASGVTNKGAISGIASVGGTTSGQATDNFKAKAEHLYGKDKGEGVSGTITIKLDAGLSAKIDHSQNVSFEVLQGVT